MTMAENGCNYVYKNHTFSLEGIYLIYLFFTFSHFFPLFSFFGFIYSASSLKYSVTYVMFPVWCRQCYLLLPGKETKWPTKWPNDLSTPL